MGRALDYSCRALSGRVRVPWSAVCALTKVPVSAMNFDFVFC